MVEIAVKLLLAAALIGGGLLWFGRYVRTSMAGSGTGLRVTGRAGLTRTSSVAVVQVDGRRFLVGAADGDVSMLAELAEVDEAELEEQADAPAPTLPWPLTSLLGGQQTRQISTAAHRTGKPPTGPRNGPLDRLREMTTRSRVERPTDDDPRDG